MKFLSLISRRCLILGEMSHPSKRSIAALLFLFLSMTAGSARAATPADEALKRDFPSLFRDMGVVQNKAMQKAGRFLFVPSFSLDFSDGPYSMYGVGARIGYALSDFWEVYLLANPKFISKERAFVSALREQVEATGGAVSIEGARAQSEYGVQLLWAPLYGKDSLGISRIIRSDTFLRVGASQIQYDIGTGLNFAVGVGKTFFLGKSFGFRVAVEESATQTIFQGQKSFSAITHFESGVALYF